MSEPAPAIYLIAHNTGEDERMTLGVWAADQPSSSYLLSLSARNPLPPHQGPGVEILPIILTVVGVEEPFKCITQKIC